MQYDFNLENPLFFIKSEASIDTSIKYSVLLPDDWHEISDGTEWINQYPIKKLIDRQGWKVHISSDFKHSHEVLTIVADICHMFNIAFKYLSSEKRFILRNGKLAHRGFSGKFITCYPSLDILEKFLEHLEEALQYFSGPYILSDKRWRKAPIYLRYGVFRPTINNKERALELDELLISDKVIKDLREPQFIVPKGAEIPDFLKNWLNKKDNSPKVEFPFVINKAIRFSNSGGIYDACLKDNNQEIILREVRPFTGLDFNGNYSSDRLNSEIKALNLLKDITGIPKVFWSGKLWEHYFLGVERMKGIPLNRWVTKNYPLYGTSVGKENYLIRVKEIIKQLINLVKGAHLKNVFHQDIHLGNILIDENNQVSLIDWEQARFDNTNKIEQEVAALGFGSWIKDYPSQIDWHGLKQVAHYLYYPLIEQSALVQGYEKQVSKVAHELFRRLSYSLEEIESVEKLIEMLDNKTTVVQDLSVKKILKTCNKELLTIESKEDIREVTNSLARGIFLVYNEWTKNYKKDRFFPVHYYGLKINQGLAFSNIGVLWSYTKLKALMEINSNIKGEEYDDIQRSVIKSTISRFDDVDVFPGLFDGIAGSIWLIYELGEKELAKNLFSKYCNSLLERCSKKNLYSGTAGVLLVGVYLISNGLQDTMVKECVLEELDSFANEYQHAPEEFCPVGFDKSQSNDPYENNAGLFYGHAGLGWLFGEAYRLTSDYKFKICLNLAIDTELKAYSTDSIGSLQYHQGKRLLPYLSTGSAGLLLLILRNKEYLNSTLLEVQEALEKAITPNVCVFPGLFNGLCGLELSKVLYHENQNIILNQRNLLRKLFAYLSRIEKGLVIAGDNGLKITTDIASGVGGVALSLISMQYDKFELLPCL